VAGIAQVTAGWETVNLRNSCPQLLQSISAAQSGSVCPLTLPNSAPRWKGRLTRTAMPRSAASGSLQLGVTSLVAGYVLSDILARYRRAYPGVEVSAIEDNGDYLEHLLIGGELDVAVMVISNLRDRLALQAEILEISPYRLWLPLSHELASAEIIGLADIAEQPLIMLTLDEIEEATGKLLLAFGAQPHVAFRTRSVEAVRSLVATGAGLGLLPDLVYRPWSLEGDRIESRDISGSLPVIQVGVVWRRGSHLPESARDFIGIAQTQRGLRQR